MADKSEAQRKAERAELAGKRVNEFESAWRWAVLEEVWAEAISTAESAPAGDNPGYTQPDKLARHIATRMATSLNTDRAKRLGKLLKLEKVAPVDSLLAHIAVHPHPTALLWLLVAEADVEHRAWMPDQHQANAGLMLAVDAFAVNVDAVQKSVKDELREKHFAEDQKALLPLAPAAQANGVRGESKAKPKGKKPPAARAEPTTSAEEAMQGIAAAMQGLEEGQAHPAGAPVEPSGSDQRATPESIEAAPHHPQGTAEPEPTCTPTADPTPTRAAAPFASGDAVLLDGKVEGVVVKRHKVAGHMQYMLRLPTGMVTGILGDRLGRVAA
jgi:hypothetical protein